MCQNISLWIMHANHWEFMVIWNGVRFVGQFDFEYNY